MPRAPPDKSARRAQYATRSSLFIHVGFANTGTMSLQKEPASPRFAGEEPAVRADLERLSHDAASGEMIALRQAAEVARLAVELMTGRRSPVWRKRRAPRPASAAVSCGVP